jgi:hypothetical protein
MLILRNAEQLQKLLGTVTQTVTTPERKRAAANDVAETKREKKWWSQSYSVKNLCAPFRLSYNS